MPKVAIKRVYEPAAKSDGMRVLVDRLWPRGMSRQTLKCDLWVKEVAPSPGLRKWFGHDPEKWAEFRKRYIGELRDSEPLAELKKHSRKRKLTLLYAARDETHNHARILESLLNRK